MVNIDYLYNPAAAKNIFDKNYFVDKKLGFQVIEHGTILPHKDVMVDGKWTWGKCGIVDNNGVYVKGSHVNSYVNDFYTPPPESIQHSSETVIYLGLFYPVWGHCLTDNIRRLWFLKTELFKSEFKNCRLVYIPWENSPLERQPNFKRLLEILKIDVDNVQPITQPTIFEKIVLAEDSFLSDPDRRKFTSEYRETIDCLRNFALKNKTPTSIKKFYYYHGRKGQLGEERLAEYFKSKGYEVISPEKLTLDEQLNLLINCESFASTLGSCAHNSLFLRDGTETIFIPRYANAFTGYQQVLNQVHPINVNYIDSTLSLLNQGIGNFCYIISEQLKRFFGDKFDGYEEDDFKDFLKYVKDSLGRGLALNPNTKKYYAPILEDFMTQLKRREDLIAAYNMPPHWEQFRSSLSYQMHVHKKGWTTWVGENQISGFPEDKVDIQAVKINFPKHKVFYSVYYGAEEGWSEEVSNGQQAGTTGKSKSIYGIRIHLDEAGQKEFDVLYRMHTFDGDWTPWARNGATLYSHGVKLNALQIKLEPKT